MVRSSEVVQRSQVPFDLAIVMQDQLSRDAGADSSRVVGPAQSGCRLGAQVPRVQALSDKRLYVRGTIQRSQLCGLSLWDL